MKWRELSPWIGLILFLSPCQGLASTFSLAPVAGAGVGNTFTPTVSIGADQLTLDGSISFFSGPGGILEVPLSAIPVSQVGPINSVTVSSYASCGAPSPTDCNLSTGWFHFVFRTSSGTLAEDTQNFTATNAGTTISKTFPYIPGTGMPWTWADISTLTVGLVTYGAANATFGSDQMTVTVTYGLPNSYTYYVSSFCGSLGIIRQNLDGYTGKKTKIDSQAALASFLLFWGLIVAFWMSAKRLAV